MRGAEATIHYRPDEGAGYRLMIRDANLPPSWNDELKYKTPSRNFYCLHTVVLVILQIRSIMTKW